MKSTTASLAVLAAMAFVATSLAATTKLERTNMDPASCADDTCEYKCTIGYEADHDAEFSVNSVITMTSTLDDPACTCTKATLTVGNCGCMCCSGNNCNARIVGMLTIESHQDCSTECRDNFSECPASGNSGSVSSVSSDALAYGSFTDGIDIAMNDNEFYFHHEDTEDVCVGTYATIDQPSGGGGGGTSPAASKSVALALVLSVFALVALV